MVPVISYLSESEISNPWGENYLMMVVDPADPTQIPRRGRPRIRRITSCGQFRCYAPQCDILDDTQQVILLPDELEILRLIDLEDLEQEEAAKVLGISRKTLWKDLHEARKKITDALVNGKLIEYSGCPRKSEGHCPRKDASFCPKKKHPGCPCMDDSPSE